MIGCWCNTLIDIFFHTQTLPRDHNFYHSTSCGLISILCSFVIVLVIGVMTAPYWRNYRISMSAPNKLSFIVLVITANPDSAFMKIEETLNIIVILKHNFILFLVWLYIIKGISRSSITLSFNRSLAREEISKIQYLFNQINHIWIIL